MERMKYIIENKKFIKSLKNNEKIEISRIYCKHGLEHAIDTARIAQIINLEKNLNIDKSLIYATALLHDIGRWKQYEEGIPHENASSSIAREILQECSFSEEEISVIVEAISAHRIKEDNPIDLKGVISLGDKLSRNCFYCNVKDKCNWDDKKKNKSIYY